MNFHIDLKDEEHEISQRVHSKIPVAHINLQNKLKSLNNDLNNDDTNTKKISLNILNTFNKNIDKFSRQSNSNLKSNTLNNYRLTYNNNKTNLIKYKTFRTNIDSNIINRFKNRSQRNKFKILDIKDSGIYKKNKVNKIVINLRKNNNNSISQNIFKTSLCSPKENNNSNKTIIYDNYTNKLKNAKIKSFNKIGDLYIKNKSLKEKNLANKNKFLNFKRNKTIINPFNNVSYEIGKVPIIKKVNYYIENLYDNNKIKNLYDNNSNNHKNSKIIQYNIVNYNSAKDINISN